VERIEDMAERIQARTRVVAVSSAQWSNGFRCDLGALGSLCRDKDIWLVVDAVQQLGAIPIDVRKTPVDFLACGGHEWLNFPFGTGFLYVRRQIMKDLHPPLAGYLDLEPPQGGWGSYFQTPSISPVGDHRFVEEARRLEIGGTANYPGAIGLAASLKLLFEVGPEWAAGRIVLLTDHLIEGLQERGLEIVTPLDPLSRSGIVTFSCG
jgi:selenocysteine lyase/cysteine desulfurase